MGPRAPETKQAWKELNECFGKCPKCKTDPFEGLDAVSAYTAPGKSLYDVLVALISADIARLGSKTSEIAAGVKQLAELKNSHSGYLQALSESYVDNYAELANVHIIEEALECKNCGVTWKPEKWEVDFHELGMVTYHY